MRNGSNGRPGRQPMTEKRALYVKLIRLLMTPHGSPLRTGVHRSPGPIDQPVASAQFGRVCDRDGRRANNHVFSCSFKIAF